jgi:hypothetical protein
MDRPSQPVIELNVRRYQQLLLLEQDACRREIIAGLLADQEQKPVDVGRTWPNGAKLLENFIHASNVERFLKVLSDKPDIRARAILLKLLKAEQEQLAADPRQLAMAERWLAEWKARVAQAYGTSASCPSAGEASRKAAEFLVTMHSVQGLLEGLCLRLRGAINHDSQ